MMTALLTRLYSFFPMRRLALAIAAFSAAALAMAFTAQYVFLLQPCILCLIQRGPYALCVALGLAAFFCKDARRRRLLISLCAASFALNGFIAAYHVGVEHHWWQFDACAANFDPSDLESLKRQLASHAVRCDQVVWSFFGISIATLNVPTSFAAALGSFLGLRFSKEA